MAPIPLKLRKEMSVDPFYSVCALAGHHGHICGGKITWEHAITYASRQLQQKWAIVPICERGHGLGKFMDTGSLKKDLNVWIALNRATEEELLEISKAGDAKKRRDHLNQRYGIWSPRIDPRFMSAWSQCY